MSANLATAYRLARNAGVALPPMAEAPVIPQEYVDQAAAMTAPDAHLVTMQAIPAVAAGIYMFDSTSPSACRTVIARLGLTEYLVGAYVDGYGGYAEAVSLFGAARVVSISVGNSNAMCADVEPGAMSVSQLPAWIARQRQRGIARPVLYSDGSDYPSVRAAGGGSCSYWTATASGQSQQVLPGRDAVQDQFDGSYDESWVLPSFPLYPGPAQPWPLQMGSAGPNVVTLQGSLNTWGFAAPPLVPDGSFGPATLLAVRAALVHWHYSAAKVAAGAVDEALWNDLAGAPPPVPVPPPVPPPPVKAKTVTGVTVTFSDGTSWTG